MNAAKVGQDAMNERFSDWSVRALPGTSLSKPELQLIPDDLRITQAGLDRGAVARRLASGQVVAMRADWTSPNPEIAAYLEDFGRFGIPFDAVYGPALPRGLALSELLTEKAVIGALDRAGVAAASVQ